MAIARSPGDSLDTKYQMDGTAKITQGTTDLIQGCRPWGSGRLGLRSDHYYIYITKTPALDDEMNI